MRRSLRSAAPVESHKSSLSFQIYNSFKTKTCQPKERQDFHEEEPWNPHYITYSEVFSLFFFPKGIYGHLHK